MPFFNFGLISRASYSKAMFILVTSPCRCTILEPGPTQTLGPENGTAFVNKFSLSDADQKSQELLGTFAGRMFSMFGSTMQTSHQVAEYVKNIILCEKPQFRYQTNAKYRPEEIKVKLADPTGNTLVEMVKRDFLDTE